MLSFFLLSLAFGEKIIVFSCKKSQLAANKMKNCYRLPFITVAQRPEMRVWLGKLQNGNIEQELVDYTRDTIEMVKISKVIHISIVYSMWICCSRPALNHN